MGKSRRVQGKGVVNGKGWSLGKGRSLIGEGEEPGEGVGDEKRGGAWCEGAEPQPRPGGAANPRPQDPPPQHRTTVASSSPLIGTCPAAGATPQGGATPLGDHTLEGHTAGAHTPHHHTRVPPHPQNQSCLAAGGGGAHLRTPQPHEGGTGPLRHQHPVSSPGSHPPPRPPTPTWAPAPVPPSASWHPRGS